MVLLQLRVRQGVRMNGYRAAGVRGLWTREGTLSFMNLRCPLYRSSGTLGWHPSYRSVYRG
jgi:hypothetical protein